MKKIQLIFTISALLFVISSCTKEGPQGPQGPEGPAGSQGVQGNANVNSYTWTTTSSNWGWSASAEYWYNDVDIPQLTSSISENGAVLVFRKSGSDWYAMPRVQNYGSTTLEERFIFSTAAIRVLWQYGNGSQYSNPGDRTFRTVLINGSGRAANPNIDYNNYEQVKRAFKLED